MSVAGQHATSAVRSMLLFLAAIAVAGPRVAAACPANTIAFRFQVERPSQAPARGLHLMIEIRGPTAMIDKPAVVGDTGGAVVCLDKDTTSGEMVDVRVPERFRVVYPAQRQVPLTSRGSSPIVVCEVGRDCSLRSEAEFIGVLQKLLMQNRGKTTTEIEASVHALKESIDQMSREANENNDKLIKALDHKERQVKAASHASELLRTFVTRARDVLDSFDLHAERLLDTRSPNELKDLNKVLVAYNGVFDEMQAKGDAYLKETSDYWRADVSDELRALITEALEIHKQGIHPLNDTKLVIIDCIRKPRGPTCRNPTDARTMVQAARRTVRDVTSPRLAKLSDRVTRWLGSIDSRLFEADR